MKPAPFEHVRIDAPEEACELLAREGEDARVLAGGQSLMAVLNMRLATPRMLLDISGTPALREIGQEQGALRVGAAVTQTETGAWPGLARKLPLLAQALPHLAHRQIRNRGTVCGSIAHADPSAELPLCLLALRGEVLLRSARGRRRVEAQAFFRGMLTTERAEDELIEAVRFPLAGAGTGCAFEELAVRRGDFAVAAVACVADARGLRFAAGGVGDRPRAIDWPRLEGAALDDALNAFAWSLEAQDDAQGSAAYRRRLVRELGRRVVTRATRAAESAA